MENQNQENVTGQKTYNIQVPSAENIASRRPLIQLIFAIAIIFFFFNFFTVSCGSQKIGSVKGINLVTGTQLNSKDMYSGRETKGEKIPANAWAIIAFCAAIIGLGAYLIKEKREAAIGTGAGAIGFGSLLILQFVVKNAIEKQAGGSPIEIDFQFAYWGALIAMGIAGYINYIRMQMTHSIAKNISPPSTVSPQSDVNGSIENVYQQTSNFDIGKWFGKNIKVVIGVFSICVVLFGVYYFFLKPNPIRDAKNLAAASCDCSTKYNDALIKVDKEFFKDFDDYGFKKREEARTKLQKLKNSAKSKYSKCDDEVSQDILTKITQYNTDKKLLDKFNSALKEQSQLCNPLNQSQLVSLNSEVENKILSIKDPLPNIKKIESDLLGHRIYDPNRYLWWDFDYLEEIKKFRIIHSFSNNNYAEFRIDLDLVGYNSGTKYKAEILVKYILNGNGWKFQNVNATMYKKVGRW